MFVKLRVIAASDVRVKDDEIDSAWTIINNEKVNLLNKDVCYKEWRNNLNVSTEALELLKLMKVIEYTSSHASTAVCTLVG